MGLLIYWRQHERYRTMVRPWPRPGWNMTRAVAKKATNVAKKKPVGHNLKGRPKGAKNKTTLFKEVMREGFEKQLTKDFAKVINVVVEKAIKGDMSAAKMLLDRVVPVSKAVDLDGLKDKGVSINISIGKMDDDPYGEKAAIEAEFTEVKED